MNRKNLINIHLFLAAFFAPVLVIVALSGTFYLLGIKGSLTSETIYTGEATEFNFGAKQIENEIDNFIAKHELDHSYEYAKGGGTMYYTRPSSRTHLRFEIKDQKLKVSKRTPDFIRSIIELHKGHGPKAFKYFQMLMGAGLMLILLSGLYLGLTSPALKNKTLSIAGIGGIIMVLLILV